MAVQYQRDARQPLPNPQQESLVQRIRQQIEAHPNLIAILVAAAGVGVAIVAYRYYQANNAGTSSSTAGTTSAGDTTGGVGGTIAPSSPTTDTSGFQATIAALQNQVGSLQNQLQTALAAIGTGGSGGSSAADNSSSAGSTVVSPTPQAIPVVSGIGSILNLVNGNGQSSAPTPPNGQLPIYGVSQGFTSVATASHLAQQLNGDNITAPSIKNNPQVVISNKPDYVPPIIRNMN